MADFEALYNQSQIIVQKQKWQIKKLEQQIRERCQSYLIHSSRYRSKNVEMQKKKSAASEPDQQLPIFSISHKTIQLAIQPTKTVIEAIPQPKITSAEATPIKQINQAQKNNENISTQKINYSSSFSQGVYWRNPDQQQTNPVSTYYQKQEQQNKKVQKNEPQMKSKQENQSHHINWEQVVSGYKDRISLIQKQKSELAQKVIELEEQVKGFQKQQKLWIESMNSMKKKQAKSQALLMNAQLQQSAKKDANEKQLSNLFQYLSNQINFNTVTTIEEKINQIINYIKELRRKLHQSNGILEQSKVDSYVYATPYRGLKNDGENSQNQSRDHYEQQQLEMLRRKCKQLQGELSLSRANKNDESPLQNGYEAQIQQQQVKNPPYLIQQELEKPNSPYVKRSFVRKKVVKRNLSAMILRSPSKSKQESKEAMKSQLQKLKSHLQKSKDGKNDKQISSMTKKIQSLERNLQIQTSKIDQISEQNQSVRASGVSDQGNFTQIIQVETEGPGYKNYTAHILGLNKKDKSTHEKQKKQGALF